MDASVLQGKLKSTAKAFLREVFGRGSKDEQEAREVMFSTILRQGTTLLSRLAKDEEAQRVYADGARGRLRRTSRKGVQEWMSRWLEKGDFDAREYLLANGVRGVEDDTTIAFDQSDISKEFGGEGMEGMAKGRDGSRGVTAMGHDVIAASAVPVGRGVAVPLLVELQKGRRGASAATRRLVDRIFEATGGRGQLAMDRGYDADEQIHFLFERGYKAVIRVKHEKRDVFGDGLGIPETFKRMEGWETKLIRARGTQQARLKYKLGSFPHEDKKSKKTSYFPVMLVSSFFDGKEIFLYVMRRSFEGLADEELRRIAQQAAQAYFDRWGVETFFLRVKQDYRIEEARVRRFKRLENLLALCVLAYLFTSQYLRTQTEAYQFVMKAMKDSLHKVAAGVQAFVVNLREMLRCDRIAYIGGRPRKRAAVDTRQLLLPFPPGNWGQIIPS
jgi:hypothetical protein